MGPISKITGFIFEGKCCHQYQKPFIKILFSSLAVSIGFFESAINLIGVTCVFYIHFICVALNTKYPYQMCLKEAKFFPAKRKFYTKTILYFNPDGYVQTNFFYQCWHTVCSIKRQLSQKNVWKLQNYVNY